jgi:cyclic pyranopterin phosphate synthase
MISEVQGIKEVDMTTNGILLEQYASNLKKAGLTRVNISLDTMDPVKYRDITGGGSLDAALSGIRAAFEAGLTPVKVNTVLIGGFNDDEIRSFAELTRTMPVELRFIELMPMGGVFGKEAYLSGQAVLDQIPELLPIPEQGGVARLFRLPDGKGKIGLISPLSRHFCGTCNRLRLTSDGCIKPCLHSGLEIPIRGKHGQDLVNALQEAILQKPQGRQRHPP